MNRAFPAPTQTGKRNVVKLTGEEIIVKEPKTSAGDRYVYFSYRTPSRGGFHAGI